MLTLSHCSLEIQTFVDFYVCVCVCLGVYNKEISGFKVLKLMKNSKSNFRVHRLLWDKHKPFRQGLEVFGLPLVCLDIKPAWGGWSCDSVTSKMTELREIW